MQTKVHAQVNQYTDVETIKKTAGFEAHSCGDYLWATNHEKTCQVAIYLLFISFLYLWSTPSPNPICVKYDFNSNSCYSLRTPCLFVNLFMYLFLSLHPCWSIFVLSVLFGMFVFVPQTWKLEIEGKQEKPRRSRKHRVGTFFCMS